MQRKQFLASILMGLPAQKSRHHWDWLRIAMECNYHDYQHLTQITR